MGIIYVPKHISWSATMHWIFEESKAAWELAHEEHVSAEDYAEMKNYQLHMDAAWYALLNMSKAEFFRRPITAYILGTWREEFLV